MKSIASAPGKVILFGEHFVVHGLQAVLGAIDKHVTVTSSKIDDEIISIESIFQRDLTKNELEKACKFACKDESDIHQLPFTVNEKDLYEAIKSYQSLTTTSNII